VHSLNCNHAFHNGNKRTSLLALAIFLEERNGRYLIGSEDDLFELIVGIARHSLVQPDETPGRAVDPYYADRELLEVHRRLKTFTDVPTRSDRSLRWNEFARLLQRFDCDVSSVVSNEAKIRRELPDGRVLTAIAGARNPGTQISAQQIRQYRKQLELTDAYGIDSSIFYDGREPHPDLPHLIKRYRGVLERLSLLDRSAPEQQPTGS
jgi:death-on-curing protein